MGGRGRGRAEGLGGGGGGGVSGMWLGTCAARVVGGESVNAAG